MSDPSKNMFCVDAIFSVPGMSVNYNSAFRDFKKFNEENAGKDISTVHISLRNADKVSDSYLFGLVENIKANPDIEWFMNRKPDTARTLAKVTTVLSTLDNVWLLDEGLCAYVKQEPVSINKTK